jgi:hypothetical protein
MTFEDCLVVVIGEDDRRAEFLREQIAERCPKCEPCFVHAPIPNAVNASWTGLQKVLTRSTREFVIVVQEAELDLIDFESALLTFRESRKLLTQPVLYRQISNGNFKGGDDFAFDMRAVVAERVDLSEVVKQYLEREMHGLKK